jgi:preprotein translocase subunit SecA
MFGGLGKMLRGDPAKKTKERLQPIVDSVNKLEPQMQLMTDEELREATQDLRKRAQSGTDLDTLLPEAFAVRTTDPRTSMQMSVVASVAHLLCNLSVPHTVLMWCP